MSKKPTMFYYKLSEKSSVFFDSKSKMKVLSSVPGRTLVKTKTIAEASTSGHIISITENEYNEMMKALPAKTQKSVEAEHSIHAPIKKESSKAEVEETEEEVEETEEEVEEDDTHERVELLKKLKADYTKKTFNDFKDKSNAEIKAMMEEDEA